MLDASDILALLDFSLSPEEFQLLLRADAGSVDAQSDMACVFHEANHPEAAVYLWKLAAEAGNADATQNLGRCYASGDGVVADEHLAVMWLSKAAAAGHAIARDQLDGLLRHRVS